uniref:Flagellin n=1 Tax=Ignisphaera aggregans TaxID=334771 RepID=A0A7J3QEI6_9CREN
MEMFKEAQADLLSVIILLGVVMVVGVGFSALVASHMSNISSESNVRRILLSEQANLVLYKEFENSTHVCIGVLRIVQENVRYSIAIFSNDLTKNVLPNGVLSIPVSTASFILKPVDAKKVYYLYNGEYYNVPVKGFVYVADVPSDVIENYVLLGKPFLICVDKNALRESDVSIARIMLFIYINQNLYEVGEWYVNA